MKKAIIEALGENYKKIAHITRNGVRWYRAHDLCSVLGIKNTSLAVRGNIRIGYFGIEASDVMRDGNWRSAPLYISEAGMFKLILKSRKPIAYRLKTILSTEVLPEIILTGSYRGESEGVVGSSEPSAA